jgi:hypothetical protein
MARKPTIGESASDKASNKYASRIDKALQRREIQKSPTLTEQLQKAFPSSWKTELEELQKENADPAYAKLKSEARASFKKEYDSIPRYQRDNMAKISGTTEGKYIARKMEQWISENRINA